LFVDQKRAAYLKALFAATAWGGSFIATKVALQNGVSGSLTATGWQVGSGGAAPTAISPLTVIWLRFAIGLLILGAVLLLRGQWALPSGKEWGLFALLGFIGITFHQWLQSTGLVTSQASTTAWIVATTPVFIALLGWLFLKEGLGWIRLGGIALAGLGVLLVVSEGDIRSLALGQVGRPGDLLILISAPNWAVFSVMSRDALRLHPATRMMFYVMGLGWLFTTLLFLSQGNPGQVFELTFAGWMGVLFLGIACSGLAYIFWYDALKALPAAQAGAFLYLEPLVAVGVAGLVLSEPVYLASLLGGLGIIAGVWLVNRPG
jgi:drug/metabolite transporter (DMT)-like permease